MTERFGQPYNRGGGALRRRRDTGEPREAKAAALADQQSPLKRTPLYDRHLRLGARMVPFAGWSMPVQYAGILKEHRVVRSAAGLFDLGHMGQVKISGRDSVPFLQAVTTNDVSVLAPGDAQYSLLPNPNGGVIDDIIIYRYDPDDGYLVVINASNVEKDVSWLLQQRNDRSDLDVSVEDISGSLGMIAIQGPRAEAIVQHLTPTDLSPLEAFSWTDVVITGIPTKIARTGYTGEDGFEFYPTIDQVGKLWDTLLAAGASIGIAPIGLGARDTLRLEARMPLYGNELADDIGPLEAGLGWAVKLDKGEFVGRDAIAAMKASGPPRRTVGFVLSERRGAARPGYEVQVDGRRVGHVTSGATSPTLGENIGLALIDRDVAGVGKPLQIVIRDKPVPATQVKLPFYRRS